MLYATAIIYDRYQPENDVEDFPGKLFLYNFIYYLYYFIQLFYYFVFILNY